MNCDLVIFIKEYFFLYLIHYEHEISRRGQTGCITSALKLEAVCSLDIWHRTIRLDYALRRKPYVHLTPNVSCVCCHPY